MKIPLQISKEKRLSVVALMDAPRYRVRNYPITFFVDTGSNETFVSEMDTQRFSIPISKMPFIKHIYIGTSVYALHSLEDVALVFKTEDNSIERINMSKMNAAVSTKKGAESRQLALSTPSLLGVDFLFQNRLKLVFSPAENIAYLENISS
jgi:predicted aspartyl protease